MGNSSGMRGKRGPILVGDSLDPMAQFRLDHQHDGSKRKRNGDDEYDYVPLTDDIRFPDEKASENQDLDQARQDSILVPMGRGRGTILPAWMTEPGGPLS